MSATATATVVQDAPAEPRRSVEYELRPTPAVEVDNEALVNVTSIEPVPPNGGYGWVCTLAVFLINAHTWGINSSWAVFMAYLSASERIKATHLEFALVGGFSISQALMISPVVAVLRTSIGTRCTMVVGAALIFVSLMTAGLASQFWHLFLSQGVCFGWGMGLTYIPASAVLPSWFSTRRSLAVGLSTSGAGLGGLAYSLATNKAVQDLGYRWAYWILAFCSLAANLPAALMLRETGGPAARASLGEWKIRPRDLGRVQVLLVMLWGVASELGYIVLLYSLPSFAASIGLSATQGSIANALLNLGLGLGRPVVGYFSDVLGRINMALALTALCTLLCFGLWIPTTTFAPLAVFAVLVGPLCSTFWTTVTPVLVEVVGMKQFASTFGAICLSLVLPTSFAESAAMQLVDEAGERSFLHAQVFVGCMFLVGSVSLWLLRNWKIYVTETQGEGERPAKLRAAWLHPRLFFRFWHV